MFNLLWVSFLVRLCLAIIPGTLVGPESLTLPNLLELEDIYGLDNDWTFHNNIKLDTGRLIIGKLGGSLWSKGTIANPDDEWTLEFVFRSSGTTNDLKFTETNGISLFLIEDPDYHDTSNFGGPAKYDGFQFLFNNKEKQGLKVYANDNSKRIENDIDRTVDTCEFSFLNSGVPFNLRVSYSKKTGYFKIQIDNNLCFRTNKIVIPPGKFHIGVAGSTSPGSEEYFEVLRVNFWDSLTEDAIDDHGLMSNGQIQVAVQKVVEAEPQKKEFIPPSAVRESLMARTKKHMAEMERLEKEEAAAEAKGIEVVESHKIAELLALSKVITDKLEYLEITVKEIKNANTQPNTPDLSSLENFEATISKNYQELLNSITQLNQKLIAEVRDQQAVIDDLGRKVDLLMANHKEIQYQATNQPINTYDASTSIIRWILITVIIVVLLLMLSVYRLRHDVKHSKLL